jgi:hypothetical protein
MKRIAFSFIALSILGFISCSPCKRIQHIGARHPGCFQSITIRDTLKIPGAKADTIFSSAGVNDTVVLQKDRLTVKYFQSNDTVFLSGECRDSVIVRQVPVKVSAAAKGGYPLWVWVIVGVAVACFGVMVGRR